MYRTFEEMEEDTEALPGVKFIRVLDGGRNIHKIMLYRVPPPLPLLREILSMPRAQPPAQHYAN